MLSFSLLCISWTKKSFTPSLHKYSHSPSRAILTRRTYPWRPPFPRIHNSWSGSINRIFVSRNSHRFLQWFNGRSNSHLECREWTKSLRPQWGPQECSSMCPGQCRYNCTIMLDDHVIIFQLFHSKYTLYQYTKFVPSSTQSTWWWRPPAPPCPSGCQISMMR